MRKISVLLLLLLMINITACSNSDRELESLKAENERLKVELELAEKGSKQSSETVSPSSDSKSKPVTNKSASTSYDSKRKEFAGTIKQALNAPGLPEMCTDAYFNSKGELIIEVNGEWLVLEKELKEDMIYALENLLRKSKDDLNVEGYGQFFSDSGRDLESFYAN